MSDLDIKLKEDHCREMQNEYDFYVSKYNNSTDFYISKYNTGRYNPQKRTNIDDQEDGCQN